MLRLICAGRLLKYKNIQPLRESNIRYDLADNLPALPLSLYILHGDIILLFDVKNKIRR